MKEKEIWKPVLGFEGRYEVSNLGNVKSLIRNRLLKPATNQKYLYVILGKNTNRKYVHRAVWEAFNGPIPDGLQINHIDENKLNNSLTNLSLVTPRENMNWGSLPEKCAKTILQYDKNGNFIKEWRSGMCIQRELGFNQANISQCANGKLKSAYGYVWVFSDDLILKEMRINQLNNSLSPLNSVSPRKNRKRSPSGKHILQYDKNGIFIKEWRSGRSIQRELGFNPSHISECARGERKYAYGFVWVFKNK